MSACGSSNDNQSDNDSDRDDLDAAPKTLVGDIIKVTRNKWP